MRDYDVWDPRFRRRHPRERRFWDDHAEAMELILEGNRLLSYHIAASIGRSWRRLRQWVDKPTQYSNEHRHSPR